MFEMKIAEIFHFQSGETVFVGSIIGTNTCIYQCRAEIVIDGIVDRCIEIRGEYLGGRHPEGYRAISTLESIEFTSEFIKNHNCKLTQVCQKQLY